MANGYGNLQVADNLHYIPQKSEIMYCYLVNLQTGLTIPIPCYPDDLNESLSATWSEANMIGRSSPIATYTGTSFKDWSFSFTFHRDQCEIYGIDLDTLINRLHDCVYPRYGAKSETIKDKNGKTVEVVDYKQPLSKFKFGDIVLEGAVTSLSIKYSKPINVKGQYMVADVGISFKSIPNKVPDYESFNKEWGNGLTGGLN